MSELIILVAAVWVGLALAVGNDATRRGHTSWGWILATLIFGIVGAVFYLIVRKPHPDALGVS